MCVYLFIALASFKPQRQDMSNRNGIYRRDMTNTKYQAKGNQNSDIVLKGAKVVFAICLTMLLMFVAVFGGVALGNKNVTNSVLGNGTIDDINVAEAGSNAGGTTTTAFYVSSFGETSVGTSFSTSNVRWTSYYSGNSHGNQTWMGAGYFGNGGKGTVRQDVTISSASINFRFSGNLVALQQKGLLEVSITATVKAKNGYDGTRTVGYKKGGSLMAVDTGSNLLSGFTTIATRSTDGGDQKQTGTKTFRLGTGDSTVCIGVGGRCNYTGWAGGRYPGQVAEGIKITCTSKDSAAPTFDLPSFTSWASTSRDATYIAYDNVQLASGQLYRNGTAITTTYTKYTAQWNMAAKLYHNYSYYAKAKDTTGRESQSATYNYVNLKLDGYSPKILRVVFVRNGQKSTLVTEGLTPTTGRPHKGTALCFILVEDYQSNSPYPDDGSVINSSGIKSVTFDNKPCSLVTTSTNLPSATTSVVRTADDGIGKAWYQCDTVISENIENAIVSVYDNVNKLGTASVSLLHLDNVPPIMESAIVTKNGTAITTANANVWFNSPAKLTLSIVDYANKGTILATRPASGLSSIVMAATKLARNTDKTAGDDNGKVAISASFNPTTVTQTPQTNGDGSPCMKLISKAEGTYVLGGITYYCYRYVIEVPILYRTSYSFTIRDKAANSITQFKYNHTTGAATEYKPLLDETTPALNSVTVVGYSAPGVVAPGNPKTEYVNARCLEFRVSASDQDVNNRNDGSGISKIEIRSEYGTLVSQWTTTTPYQTGTAKSLFVYDNAWIGTYNSTKRGLVDMDSWNVPYYNVLIYDAAGNVTNMSLSTATGSMQINPNGTSQLKQLVFVDNRPLEVKVKSGETLLTPGTEVYSGNNTTRIYEFDWTRTSKSISIEVAFGCSGATLYQYSNTLQDTGRIKIGEWSAGNVNSTYNRRNNIIAVSKTYGSEGINYYSFKAINGAVVSADGKGTDNDSAEATYTNIVIKVKVDKTAPTFDLLGFGTSISPAGKTDIESIRNSIVSPLGSTKLTEALLTESNSYYGAGFQAYYYIKDTSDSAFDDPIGTSWLSGGLATSQVTVKHKYGTVGGVDQYYEYTYNVNYVTYVASGATFTILTVDMYKLSSLKNMTYQGIPIYNSTTDTYNLSYGNNVIYNINIKDAVGNTGSITGGPGVIIQGQTDLSYNVDPFPIHKSNVLTPKDTTYNYEYFGHYNEQTGETGWTNLNIKYTINKQTSISPVVCAYRLVTMSDDNATHTPIIITGTTPDDYPWITIGDLGSANTATFELNTISGSRCAFVQFRIYKSYAKHGAATDEKKIVEYNDINNNPQKYIIKQDVDVPIVTAIFFSRNRNITVTNEGQALANTAILAYFRANFSGNSYTFTRLTTANTNVWTYEQFYMYVIATDSRGTGSGAGVKAVTLYNQSGVSANAVYVCDANTSTESPSPYTGEKVYRSASANFGYESATNTNAINFRLIDNAPVVNVTSQIAVTTDTDSARILPRVDTSLPSITLTRANYGTGTDYVVDNKLSGDSISENLDISISYTWGISGASIYRVDKYEYYKKGYTSTADDPWSFNPGFTGTSIATGDPNSLSGLFATGNLPGLNLMFTKAPGTSGLETWTDTISNNVETRARYYYFIVSNVNEYAGQRPIGYLTAGDIFIDNTEPTIDSTVYVSETTGNVMNINTVYTNDNVWAYLNVSDGASGIYNVYLKSGAIADNLDAYVASGTALTYIDSGAYAGSYKYTMTGNIQYQFIVFDTAGNLVVSSAVTPKIDIEAPSIAINTKLANGTTNYLSGDPNRKVFTNSPYIKVEILVNLGMSGLNRLMYSIDGTNYYNLTTLLDKDGNPVTLTTNLDGSVSAKFSISQSYLYNFMAENRVTATYSKDGNVPTAYGLMNIAIDTVKPSLNESNLEYVAIKNQWHNVVRNIILDASDNNGGSGIDKIHLFYTSAIDGLNYDQFFKFNPSSGKFETYTLSGQTVVFNGDFALSEFITYNIEIYDIATNKSNTYTIRPALDTTTPGFNSTYTMSTVDGTYAGATDIKANWTKNNVDITLSPKFTMSGADVQVAIKTGTNWGNWTTIKTLNWDKTPISNIPNTDAGNYIDSGNDFVYTVSPQEGSKSVNAYYKFRIISRAGLEYVDTKEVLIQIDQEKPAFDNGTTIADLNNNGFSPITLSGFESTQNEYTYTFGASDWSSKGVSILLDLLSTPASGYTLQYAVFNVTQDKWQDWTTSTVNPYVFDSSTPGVNYKFRYISGSQIASKELVIYSIKVDKQAPKVNLAVRTSFTGVTTFDGSFEQADKNTFDTGGDYTTDWTNAKYVVLKVSASFGYSGADLYFKADGTMIEQNSIGIAFGESGELYYYIPYTVALEVSIVSRSGLTGVAEKAIRIDNLLPELYVSEISGTRSTNWDDTVENSWFTSSTYFKFGVGTYKNKTGALERNLDNLGNAVPSPSGFVIEYRTRTATEGYTEWAAISSTTVHDVLTMDILEGKIYRFRIRSESGMINELGQDIMYNEQVIATTAEVDTNVQQYHSGALFTHLTTNKYDYLINMDRNVYYITTSQNIKFFDGAYEQNSFSTDYATYTYKIFVDDEWVLTSDYRPGKDYEYKHGDLIRVSYQSNYDQGKYLHRYTDYIEYYDEVNNGVTERTVINAQTFVANNSQEEHGGAIEFRFTKNDYSIESYFKQELTATYTNKLAYVQNFRQATNPTVASNIELKYYYKVGDVTYSTDLEAALSYTNMLTNVVQNGQVSVANNSSIGGYLITALLDNEINRQSFIITNPNDILLIKYFTVNGDNPYTVNDQSDLEMVSSSYYDSYNLATLTLNPAISYLSGNFEQTADIVLDANFTPIGEFTGTYDGNGKTISFTTTQEANGSFGLFTSITGTASDFASVSNLAISIPNVIVQNAQNVGILAGSMTYAKINNIWINANLTINTAQDSANIGGLAGIATNAQIGALSANYIDVRMLHNGNVSGNTVGENTSIGGVMGYANVGTYLFNTYNFGSMEIFGVENSINVGAVIGTLAQYVTLANKDNYFANNKYLQGNVFVNGNLISEFIGTDNSAVLVVEAIPLYYSDFVELTDTVVGRTIRDSILRKLYQDFGMEVTVDGTDFVYTNGIGTVTSMLEISTVEHIETINEYVMLNYQLIGNVDMTGFSQSIAPHKIFTGILEGKNGDDAMLTNFEGIISDGYYGLFANVDGTIRNIVFDDLKVDIVYEGSDDLYIGLVAGKSYANADISNIIAIGYIKISAVNSDVVAGGLVGESYYGYIYNIFNMANIKVNSNETSLGGIIGASNNTVLVNRNGVSDAIFSLARVEGNHIGFGDVGAIVGNGNLLEASSDMTKVFALADNTYSNGSITNRTVGSSSANKGVLTNFANSAMRSTSVSDGNLFNEVFVTRNLYPLQGISETLSSTVGADQDNPFMITNEEDFNYINNALYAYYRIVAPDNKITFENFETIGEGLYFTGKIDGKTAASGSAEEGEVVSLDGVSDSLVYYNMGTISDFSVNVNYTKNLSQMENAEFGAIAKYNKGIIRNVIVSGDIVINGGNSVTASGFVGIDYGGIIDNSSVKNSISSIDITVNGANTIYIGGYVGKVIGETTISFAIGQGNLYIVDCPSYYAGWLIGGIEGNIIKDLSLIQNYAYTVNITEDGQTTTILANIDNYTGLNNG